MSQSGYDNDAEARREEGRLGGYAAEDASLAAFGDRDPASDWQYALDFGDEERQTR